MCELENLPALIGQLTAVAAGFEKLYKTRLGLALMPLAYLCVEVYVQRLVARAKFF